MNRQKAKLTQIEVCNTALSMYHSGLVAGTWGNISGRVDDEYMVITPSGMDYERLAAEDMVIINMHTLAYEGNLKPSVEAVVHASIYLDRPEVNGIMHTHSTYALTVATARKPIPPVCDDQVQILGGEVRLAAYTMPGTKEMAEEVVGALKERAGALIANHGAITVGRTLTEAYVGSQVLEKAAMVYINSQSIGGPVEISQEDIDFFHDFFLNKYGQR
ncbi:class II aldolase/adducin family protein [[Clostridium] hylemonae]|nr:class II aldolase/adducin family protein [[Clostridium] hylemonae]QEK19311.1 L-fuculose phosphate aldolase [[Clostridium] hylemonae DSM 15053]